MQLFIKIATVFAIGLIELWGAIPTGLALKLNPIITGITSASGSIVAAMLVIFLGDKLRNWLIARKESKRDEGSKGRVYQIWEKYGVIGLGLLSPLLTGAPLGAAIGVSLGAPTFKLLFWMTIGIIIWTVILTSISVLGFVGLGVL